MHCIYVVWVSSFRLLMVFCIANNDNFLDMINFSLNRSCIRSQLWRERRDSYYMLSKVKLILKVLNNIPNQSLSYNYHFVWPPSTVGGETTNQEVAGSIHS